MQTYVTVHVVALNNDDKYLVLQRAKTRSDPLTWNFVTGHIRDRESAEEAALRELKEETNLSGKIIKTTAPWASRRAVPYWVDINDVRWVVIASLIKVANISDLKVDKAESYNYKWIAKEEFTINTSTPNPILTTFRKLRILD